MIDSLGIDVARQRARAAAQSVPAWAWVLTFAAVVGAFSAVLATLAVGQSMGGTAPLKVPSKEGEKGAEE